ncbi:MAG: imidazoleglycerol-phosphate dehydratase, partial [Synergistales bacterium]|nr:imidazoleglycerol-phosphate dehydratase [Synergistales bacterium]
LALTHPGGGTCRLDLPCGFLAHMLELLAFHGRFDLEVQARGDVQVDAHHLTEDLGIVLGEALGELARSEPRERYGWCLLPMDGSLVLTAADLGGRGQFEWKGAFPAEKCGDFDMELIPEFWKAFCREGKITLHAQALACDNAHHLAEALFKGAGRALRDAFLPSENLQSTKGTLV